MDFLIIAQIVGAISLIFNIISTQQNTKEKIFLFNGISNVACIIQYLLLGATTGAISSVIATTRNIVFSRFKKKIPIIVLIVYLIIAISFNAIAVDSIYDIIPIINICLYGIGIYQKDIRVLKCIIVIVGITGFTYDAINMAFVSMINQLISATAGAIGLIRYIKNNKAK